MNRHRATLHLKEQILLFKQLGLLMQGGISITGSLQTIRDSTKKRKLRYITQHLIQEIEKGRPLSTALLQLPKTFHLTAANLIEIGELSGTLAHSLIVTADELHQNHVVRKKVIAALIYPAIIVVATGGVIGLLIFFVFPKVLPIFASVNAKLPLTTRLLVQSNILIKNHLWYVVSGIALMILGIWSSLALKKLKKPRDRLLLALPFIGTIVKNYILAHFCRTLGQLLQNQVPIIKAVVITADTTKNVIYKQRIIALSMALNRGYSMAKFLENEEALFPPKLRQLVLVGEKSGTLSDNLIFLGRLYEEEIQDSLNKIGIIVEPAMMIAIGGLVGFVAVSIITPIYQITQNLHG